MFSKRKKEYLKYIKWVPTYLCNCRCVHCDALRESIEECDLSLVADRIKDSKCFKNGVISIAGGEPFFKKGIGAVLAQLYNTLDLRWLDITTNGTCLGEIKSFCDTISDTNNIFVNVSIDGTSEVHNRIRQNSNAFEAAVQAVNLFKKSGISVSINFVIQKDNIDNMEAFREIINSTCGDVQINWIPLLPEAAGENYDFPYTKQEVERIYPYLQENNSALFKNYIERKGNIIVEKCHAGHSSIMISPDGKVFPCLTGKLYKKWSSGEEYCIGDLRKETLDEVFVACQDENAEYKRNIKCCKCRNYCEISVEELCYGAPINRFFVPQREDVINCYRYILGREPEHEDSITYHLSTNANLEELQKLFLNSQEFKNRYDAERVQAAR